MKNIILIISLITLSACSGIKNEVHIVDKANEPVVFDKENNITKTYISKSDYNNALKLEATDVVSKLKGKTLPKFVILSGTLSYTMPINDSNAKMQSFLRGAEEAKIEGTYFFNAENKQTVAASFPVGAAGYDKFKAYTLDSGKRVEGLLCKPNVIKESGGTFNNCSFPIFD